MMGVAVVLIGVAIWLAQNRPSLKPTPRGTEAVGPVEETAGPKSESATAIVVDSDWDRLRLRLESEYLRLFRAGDRAALLRLTSRTLRGALEEVGITRDRVDERPLAAAAAGAGRAPVSWRIQVPPRASLFRINDAVTQAMTMLGGRVIRGAERPGQKLGTALDLRVGYGDRATHAIVIEPDAELVDAGARIAFVVLDLPRDSTALLMAYRESPIPFTFALRPDARGAAREAKELRDGKREVFLQLAMEPRGYPSVDPGKDAILLDLSRIEIEDRIARALTAIAPVSGVISRLGGAAVNDNDVMRSVLGELRRRGLPFIDAHGAGPSVVEEVAEETGARTIAVGGTLDGGGSSPAAVRARLKSLAQAATQRGALVVACRASAVTLSVLEGERAALRNQGIELVAASEVIP